MTGTFITCSVIGDYVVASSAGSTATLHLGSSHVQVAIVFSDDAAARRFANAVCFARTGQEHSALRLREALDEASQLADAMRFETSGNVARAEPVELAGTLFDLDVLSKNLGDAGAALYSAISDMDATLTAISAHEAAGMPVRQLADACLSRVRSPRREGQLTFFDLGATHGAS